MFSDRFKSIEPSGHGRELISTASLWRFSPHGTWIVEEGRELIIHTMTKLLALRFPLIIHSSIAYGLSIVLAFLNPLPHLFRRPSVFRQWRLRIFPFVYQMFSPSKLSTSERRWCYCCYEPRTSLVQKCENIRRRVNTSYPTYAAHVVLMPTRNHASNFTDMKQWIHVSGLTHLNVNLRPDCLNHMVRSITTNYQSGGVRPCVII